MILLDEKKLMQEFIDKYCYSLCDDRMKRCKTGDHTCKHIVDLKHALELAKIVPEELEKIKKEVGTIYRVGDNNSYPCDLENSDVYNDTDTITKAIEQAYVLGNIH